MGFLSGIGSFSEKYSPQGVATSGAKQGGLLGYLSDPMDLYGERAELAQEQQNQIAETSAQQSMDEMRRQYYASQEMLAPYSQYGTNALAAFGQYEQDPYFGQQLQEGSKALRGSAAASGMSGSSAAGNQLASFINQLTGEDTERQYLEGLNAVRIGQGAVGSIGQAASQLGQGASGVYGQQGQLSNLAAQNYGQQRQGSMNNLAQTMQGMGSYAAA